MIEIIPPSEVAAVVGGLLLVSPEAHDVIRRGLEARVRGRGPLEKYWRVCWRTLISDAHENGRRISPNQIRFKFQPEGLGKSRWFRLNNYRQQGYTVLLLETPEESRSFMET